LVVFLRGVLRRRGAALTVDLEGLRQGATT
jgi:hypothetical protein